MSSPVLSQSGARVAVCLTLALLLGALLFVTLGPNIALALDLVTTQDTVAQFNPGYFYHTGLTAATAGGGDSNGQVRLLNVGINAATWITNVTASGLPTTGLYNHAAAIYTNANNVDRIYVTGGNNGQLGGAGFTTTACYTTINANTHVPGSWTCPAQAVLPVPLQQHASVALNGYLYVIGGLDNNYKARANVYKSSIQSGAPGVFSETNPLPVDPNTEQGLVDTRAVVVRGHVYVLGGRAKDGVARDYIFIGTQDGAGNLTWVTSTVSMPQTLDSHQVAVADPRSTNPYNIYLMGGKDATGNSLPYAYYTTVDPGGTLQPWTKTKNSMPQNWVFGSAISFADQVYVAGGATNQLGSPQKNVISDLIDPDGDYMNIWTNNYVLHDARVGAAAVLSHDGWIYVIEGATGDGTAPLKTLDYGPTAAATGDLHYAPDGTYTSPSLTYSGTVGIGQVNIKSLHVKSHIAAGTAMSITWRTSNDPNFAGVPYDSPQVVATGDVTFTVDASDARYLQYAVSMQSDPAGKLSPVLNRVDVTFDAPPPATNTPTSTPAITDTPTRTKSVTNTRTPTRRVSITATPTKRASITPTKTPRTPTKTPTRGPTRTFTPTKPPTRALIEDQGYRIEYGGWKYGISANALGGMFRYSQTANDTVSFFFNGTKAYWITRLGPIGGKAQVCVDNKSCKTYDLYRPTYTWKVIIPIGPFASAAHKITVRVTGLANVNSRGKVVINDGFKLGTTVYADNSNQVYYNHWTGTANVNASGKNYHDNPGTETDLTHEAVSFHFSGTGVTWRTVMGPKRGIAAVYIDNVFVRNVSTYYATTVWKKDIPFTGLTDGPHVIRIEITGTKVNASGGPRVAIDSFIGIPN